jgi:hypothetical protein
MLSPFGGVPALEVTVAVKVTACPIDEGFSDEISVVAVDAMIVCSRVADVLPELLASLVY